jgi:two-component system sensor histidine kinase KdpD
LPPAPGSAPRAAAGACTGGGAAACVAAAASLLPVSLVIAAVTLTGTLIASLGSVTNIALLYLLPVMLAATRYGLASGIFAGLASSLAYNFFFIPPVHTFTIADPQNIITVLVLLGWRGVQPVGGAPARTGAAFAAQRHAEQRAGRFARQLAGIRSREELGQVLCAEAARMLDARGAAAARRRGAERARGLSARGPAGCAGTGRRALGL